MDPATIAGLVLGVIPLLISAAENYEVTFQPFVTYRRHIKEVQRFKARLDAQRAIFQNECQLLLLAVDQNLTDILRDPNHPSRSDEQLSKRLRDLLGNSYNSCISTLKLINDTLEEISQETRGFQDLLDKKKSKGKISFSLFRQKIKISFSKTRLNDTVNELRLYNEDLGRLSNQIQQLADNQVQSSPTVTNTVTSHLYLTRQASIRLYDVLASGWACDDRVEHLASMSLKVEDKGRQSASKVKFNLAVTCVKPRIQTKPLWLEIESAPNEQDIEAATAFSHPIQALTDSLIQQVNQDTSQNEHAVMLQTALKKRGAMSKVRFALSSTVTTKTSLSRAHPSLGPQLDLCAIGKLCGYFQQLNLQPPGDPCMGFLEKSKTFKHFVYRAAGPISQSANQSLSLKQLLSASVREAREDDWVEKLRLARLLSLAVLRFHSTPWLRESWSSSDVCFYQKDVPFQLDQLLECPCLKTQLSTNLKNITHPIASASSLASNEALFNLGVILIELGYNAPFETLSEAEGLQAGTHKQVTDFIAARRLGESVHKKLNMTYGRLVEKCLNCNFGVATKLEDMELQSAVVVHVVNQLDICLEQYKAFNALAPIPIHL